MKHQIIHLSSKQHVNESAVLELLTQNQLNLVDMKLQSDAHHSLLSIKIEGDAVHLEGKIKNLGYEFCIFDNNYEVHNAKLKYVITAVNRNISSSQLAKIIQTCKDNDIDISAIKQLSGEHENRSNNKCCYEIKINALQDLAVLRSNFSALVEEIGVDICVNEDTFARTHIKLAVFDIDSTLIQCECINELAARCGIGDEVAAITASAMRGEIDFNESFTKRMALLEGLSEDVLEDIAAQLPLTEGVVYLMRSLKKLGIKTALLSGGFNYFANYLKNMLDIDYAYANELEIVDGKVTGRVTGEVVNGERKRDYLIEIARKEKIDLEQVAAIGDGANDLPMIKVSGLGVAFHAKPLVRAEAGNSISNVGLDGLLYLFGKSDSELNA